MSSHSFNLIDEPWIRVRMMSGEVVERSLRATLAEAADIKNLAGELPTQDAAVFRLLLAVLLGATRPRHPRTDDECLDLFEDWWGRGSIPTDFVDPYLELSRARFDLLHPETPFYQVAGLTTSSGNRSGLGKLIADLPANQHFFTTRGGAASESLSLAEAARWIVHCQAFDAAGIKTGAVGDERVRGGRGYSLFYPAWAGNLGLVIAVGRNLFETLTLNIPRQFSGPDDLPLWEREHLGPGVDETHPVPSGPADLFTWPSRRIRLIIEGARVCDVQISNGDRLDPHDLHPFEPMSGWKTIKAQPKTGGDTRMPKTHDPTRQIWQGLGPLLQRSDGERESRPAAVIEWLALLRQNKMVSGAETIDLWTVGLAYGTQNSVITALTDDKLGANIAALTEPILVQAAVDASAQASRGVVALANLAGNLDRAAGGEGKARERTFELGYALLDPLFRDWARQLTDGADVPQLREGWNRIASAALRQAADELVLTAGPAALVGRPVSQQGSDTRTHLDAGLAQLKFHAALRATFPTTTTDEVKP